MYSSRALTFPADFDLLASIAAASEPIDQIDLMFDRMSLATFIANPAADLARDLRCWLDAAGSPAATSMLRMNLHADRIDGRLWPRVLPHARSPQLEAAIVDWAVGVLRDFQPESPLPRNLIIAVNGQDAQRLLPLQTQGFRTIRAFTHMDRPLSAPLEVPSLPAGYRLRTTGVEDDLERWADLFNASFVDHWNFHPLTAEQLRISWTAPGYDRSLDIVLEEPDGTFAAFCTAEIPTIDIGIGYIEALGTRRGRRGSGFGRAVLSAGLNVLQQRGLPHARLLVDRASPTQAEILYQKAGFQPVYDSLRLARTVPRQA